MASFGKSESPHPTGGIVHRQCESSGFLQLFELLLGHPSGRSFRIRFDGALERFARAIRLLEIEEDESLLVVRIAERLAVRVVANRLVEGLERFLLVARIVVRAADVD